MKTLPTTPVHDGSRFFWHMGVGSCDASDLGQAISGRMYADACDVGFVVRSHRTGATKAFTLVHTYTAEGEAVAWKFEAADGRTIIVHND